MGKKRGARSTRVELNLPDGAEFVQGKQKTDLGHLEGRANKGGLFGGGGNGTDNRARAEWVIRIPDRAGGGTVSATVINERAGTLWAEVSLS
jgi:hypothetical protein